MNNLIEYLFLSHKCRKNFLILSFLLLPLLNQNGFSQLIDADNFNHLYLEQQIKTGIDSLRQLKGLSILANDSILFLASKDHADHMLRTDDFRHEQRGNKLKETPHKRIQFYGGQYSKTGENIAKNFAFITVGSKSGPNQSVRHNDYKSLAKAFVEAWKNSPGHYKNIITPDFNLTGVAVSYNPVSQAVYAVQKFGKTESEITAYSPTMEIPADFGFTPSVNFKKPRPHRKHAWNIKSGEKIKNRKRYESNKKRYLDRVELVYFQDVISLRFSPINVSNQFFKHKRDGVAVEIIPVEHYINDSIYFTRPALRNGSCIFNGFVLEPLYKKEIDEYVNALRKSKYKYLHFRLGHIPESVIDLPYKINILILDKNRIIDKLEFSHLNQNLMRYPVLMDTLPLTYTFKEVTFPYRPVRDTLFHRIYFDRNKTEIDTARIAKVLTQIRDKKKKPVFGAINAFASIEGPEELNKKLFEKRAENLIQILHKELSDSIKFAVNTEENWDMFINQLMNTDYSFLRDSSELFIKEFLTDEKLIADFERILNEQRYVSLFMIFEEITTEESLINYAIDSYMAGFLSIQTRLNKDSRYNIRKRDIDNLLIYQQYLFNKIREGKITIPHIENLPYQLKISPDNQANKKEADRLSNEYLAFYIANHPGITLADKYNLYRNLAFNDEGDPGFSLNYFILTIDKRYHDGSFKPDAVLEKRFIERLKFTIDKSMASNPAHELKDLMVYFHIMNLTLAYYSDPELNFSRYRNSTNYIYQFFSDTSLDEQLRYQAVNFLNLTGAKDYGFNIIESIYKTGTTDREIIKDYFIYKIQRSSSNETVSYRLIQEAEKVLSREEWCNLFLENPTLDLSILDSGLIRNLFCKNCGCK